MSIVQTINLAKTYDKSNIRNILCDISISICKGEFVAIAGPSGCGKSTLLSILGLLQPPTSGDIIINGISCAKLSGTKKAIIRRNTIGFVFQDFALLSNYTVQENILLPFVYDGILLAGAIKRCDEITEILGINKLMRQYPSEVSGGEKQRVALARTFIRAPAIIFADEPTGNLDPKNSEFVCSCFREISGENGATIVVVTHDICLAEKADRIITLNVNGVKP